MDDPLDYATPIGYAKPTKKRLPLWAKGLIFIIVAIILAALLLWDIYWTALLGQH